MAETKRVLNMRPDAPDFRDRMYQPILRALEPEYNAHPYAETALLAGVKHQGNTSACTGFALSVMVETLVNKRWLENNQQGEIPQPYSPFMLYYFARRYDEFGNDDEDGGSTARAAMKAWHKHGACRHKYWKTLKKEPSTADQGWVSDGFKTPLGAYYRIDHQSIADMHAALTETGIIYVTAETHSGWDTPTSMGVSSIHAMSKPGGGHAFLIVGYDERGFWIQNSWGTDWGLKGFAHLSYTDWLERGWDAWVGQLGVYVTSHLDSLGSGLQFKRTDEVHAKVRGKAKDPLPAGRAMLSANVEVQAQQINPYIVNLENNGALSNSGKFRTSPQDLEDLANFYLNQAIKDWGLGDDEPINVALYAHGGLVSEESASGAAATWIPALYASKIFPVFFMWETGLLDTIGNILTELVTRDRAAGKGFFNRLRDNVVGGVQDFIDERLEGLIAPASTTVWEEIKENAERATTNAKGGLRLLARALSQLDKSLIQRIRFT